ncbi:MAG: LacI family DNA-binding transcriptional regulator [Bacteroidota bacterium]
MKKKQVTLLELAKRLNLSPSTVSRALNGRHRISEETRNRVRALAEELEYQPNPSAKRLRESKTYVLGVLVPEIAHGYFSEAISGMEGVALSKGYSLVICQSHESSEREKQAARTLLFSRVDGLLFCPSQETKEFKFYGAFLRKDIPIVFFDRFGEGLPASRVSCNDYQGAKDAVKHLIERGHKRIAHLGAPAQLSNSQGRLNGYMDALREAGMSIDEDLIRSVNLDQPDVRGEVEKLWQGTPPDAIFCFNDYLAYDLYLALEEKGISIPGDVSVMGFGDEGPSRLVYPKLTSVNQPARQIGEWAAKLMIDQLSMEDDEAEPDYQSISLDTTIVERGSVK